MITPRLSKPDQARPPLALIAGPTASGKSDSAVRLALASKAAGRRAVIINADSAQVYADLAVLSARPTADDQGGVDHRLFGVWDGAEACSAADWAARARIEIDAVHADGALPILVGGSGLYLRTLLNGIAPVPPIAEAVRSAVRALPTADAFAALTREDPAAAARLAPADAARIARALEVVCATGRTLADWQTKRCGGIADAVALHPLVVLPDRQMLYDRCDARFARMLQNGATEEVAALLARCLDPALPVMRAIGVREIAALLRGESTWADALARGQQATRNYAKRQFTWFRNQLSQEWPQLKNDNCDIHEKFAGLFR